MRARVGLILFALLAAGCRRTHPAPTRRTPSAVPANEEAPVVLLETPPPARSPRMFRFDARHTGRSGYRLPRNPVITARFTTRGRITS